MATSPTQLSLKKMRDEGFVCEVVEHWNPFARVRKDLFGFIDVLCIRNGVVVGVQCTSYSNISARVKKIKNHENFDAVLASGIMVVVHGWRKVGGRWEYKIIYLCNNGKQISVQ